MSTDKALSLSLEPANNERLANLCGQFDEHIRQIEKRLGVQISARGNQFWFEGDERPAKAALKLIKALYHQTLTQTLTPEEVHLFLQESGVAARVDEDDDQIPEVVIKIRRAVIRGRGPNQKQYLMRMSSEDINFGIGPAGTGKTYLAVARAVEALESESVQRIILVRPAVEAGEKLGFLPGDMSQKVDPYLRPLYDALYEMLGFEKVNKLVERNVIEVAPLAFMRGRTLNDAFVILDESQNTTVEQMKMFLTRIGFGSIAAITGDITQIDLPKGQRSGLKHAMEVLRGVEGIAFTFFTGRDVVRHPLVKRVVAAYEAHEKQHPHSTHQ